MYHNIQDIVKHIHDIHSFCIYTLCIVCLNFVNVHFVHLYMCCTSSQYCSSTVDSLMLEVGSLKQQLVLLRNRGHTKSHIKTYNNKSTIMWVCICIYIYIYIRVYVCVHIYTIKYTNTSRNVCTG